MPKKRVAALLRPRPDLLAAHQILLRREVADFLRRTPATVRELEKRDKTFPRAFRISTRRYGYDRSEFMRWFNSRRSA
jgi:predicted DNA-binding transcriptional regulator AlpA